MLINLNRHHTPCLLHKKSNWNLLIRKDKDDIAIFNKWTKKVLQEMLVKKRTKDESNISIKNKKKSGSQASLLNRNLRMNDSWLNQK